MPLQVTIRPLIFGLLFTFFYVCFGAAPALAADSDSTLWYRVRGTVQDEDRGLVPITQVVVQNLTRRTSTRTDSTGAFEMNVAEGDTLRFRKFTYGTRFFFFRSKLGVSNYAIQVLMHTDTLRVRTYVVRAMSKRRSIQNQFMNSYLRDSLRMIRYLEAMRAKENRTFIEKASEAYSSPFTFLYDNFGRKARQRNRIDRYRAILEESRKKEEEDDYAR